jgi:hypothetical protein
MLLLTLTGQSVPAEIESCDPVHTVLSALTDMNE